jgi:hypothetical protein
MLVGNKHTQESITWNTPRKPVPKAAIPAAVFAKLAEGGAGAFVAFVEKQQLAASRRSDSPDWIPSVAITIYTSLVHRMCDKRKTEIYLQLNKKKAKGKKCHAKTTKSSVLPLALAFSIYNKQLE